MFDEIVNLTPTEPPAEADLQLQVGNLVAEILEALNSDNGVVEQAVLNWAAQTGTEPNAFMRDSVRASIFSMTVGFMNNVSVHQFTTEHLEDYFRVRANPSKPAPDPVEK